MFKSKIVFVLGAAVATLGVASVSHASVLADWTFETSVPTTAGPISPEIGSGAASGSHAGAAVYSTPAGNGSPHSFSSNTWAVGDYYQFSTSTTGYQDIAIQWDQTSSNTGPGQFELDYSTDGTNFTALDASYTVLANVTPNAWSASTGAPASTTGPISATSALDNQPTIYFRLMDNSTTSANGGSVASGGTDRVDNVIISASPVPEPATLSLLGIGAMGLIARRRK